MNDWQETGAVAEGAVLTFAGINRDEQDKLDLENFARGLKAPAKEDAGGNAFARLSAVRDPGRAMSPAGVLALGLGLLFAGTGWFVADGLGLDSKSKSCAGTIGLFVALLALMVFKVVRSKQATAVKRSTTDTFRLRMTPMEFSLEGDALPKQSFAAAEIQSFEGGLDILVHGSNGVVKLPCNLPMRDHAALSARLNELLAEAKVLSGGYRGG